MQSMPKQSELAPQQQLKYQQEIKQWYIEWEPQWEDEHQVRMLGYGKIVDQTLHHLSQAPQPQPQPPKDAHLSNKDRQGNSGPTYPTTLGEPVRDTCTFITTDTDPTQTFTGQDTTPSRGGRCTEE
jgi:hypothetical protein